jgi:lipopolysaccharide export system ATP-binding protein
MNSDNTHKPSDSNNTHKLSIEHIQKTYGQRQILKDVHFHVNSGEIFGLFGPNGTGKTTCFDIITGIIEPDKGTIKLNGHVISNLPIFQRARLGIGYLPQESCIFKGLSLQDNILAVLQYIEPKKVKQQKILNSLLKEFSLEHIRHSLATSLSGGEKRRLEIARCLATNPLFILLDEPLAGIDPITINDIKRLISHLKNRGIGVLITDHNVSEILSFLDRTCILHNGKTLAEGTPHEISQNPEVRKLYLGEHFSL